jgi:hypothetical protein
MGLTLAEQIRWIEAKIYQEEIDPDADFGLWSEVLESLRWLQRLLAEAEESDGSGAGGSME